MGKVNIGFWGNRFGDDEFKTILKVRSSILSGLRKFFDENGFIEIHPPHITKATGACENIDTMFILDYFGRQVYLSQTGQLYLEVLTPFLKKVWCTIHSFRAENEVDDRHLTEFILVELEFAGDFSQLLKYIEEAIWSSVKEVFERNRDELKIFGVDSDYLEGFKPPYRKITYTEAIDILKAEYGLNWGDDLKSIHEKKLVEIFGGKPLFITHFPKKIKFFNMRENDDNPDVVNSADLILPYSGEAVGAAEREYRYERLLKRLLDSQMYRMLVKRGGSIEDFDWYLDFWKNYGETLHSGCGIGLNRLLQSILKLNSIMKTTAYPMNRLYIY